MVSPWSFRDKRFFLPADRGRSPPRMTLWLQKHRFRSNASAIFLHHQPINSIPKRTRGLRKISKKSNLKALIPKIFPPPPNVRKEVNVLHRGELSNRNAIVHPTSYRINGIIDWESVCICPAWQASEYPHVLKGINTTEPLVEIRKDWEKVRRRSLYLESLQVARKYLKGIPLLNKAESDVEMNRKQIFEDLLQEIKNRWTAARHWIPILISMDIDVLDTFLWLCQLIYQKQWLRSIKSHWTWLIPLSQVHFPQMQELFFLFFFFFFFAPPESM